MKRNRHIYIALICAHTGLGAVARRITGYRYTHAAVCLDSSLTDFISYSRRRHYLPADAGFMHEKRDFYAFGKHTDFAAKVYRINVSEENYERVLRFISACESDPQQRFNLFSMATMPLLHGFRIYKTHNCMSFAARVAELSGAIKLTKPYYRYSIKELDELLCGFPVFEGIIRREPSAEYQRYMERPTASEYLCTAAGLAFELTKRMILHKGETDE